MGTKQTSKICYVKLYIVGRSMRWYIDFMSDRPKMRCHRIRYHRSSASNPNSRASTKHHQHHGTNSDARQHRKFVHTNRYPVSHLNESDAINLTTWRRWQVSPMLVQLLRFICNSLTTSGNCCWKWRTHTHKHRTQPLTWSDGAI